MVVFDYDKRLHIPADISKQKHIYGLQYLENYLSNVFDVGFDSDLLNSRKAVKYAAEPGPVIHVIRFEQYHRVDKNIVCFKIG